MKNVLGTIISAIFATTLAIIAIFLIQNGIDRAYEQGGNDGMTQFSRMVIEEFQKSGSLTLNLPETGPVKLMPVVINDQDL